MHMLTDHLSHIDVLTWIDEELTTVLQLINSIGEGVTRLQGNHRTIHAALNLTLVRLVLLEAVCHNGLTLRSGQHIGTQANDTA